MTKLEEKHVEEVVKRTIDDYIRYKISKIQDNIGIGIVAIVGIAIGVLGIWKLIELMEGTV